jgi:hypothetical protein
MLAENSVMSFSYIGFFTLLYLWISFDQAKKPETEQTDNIGKRRGQLKVNRKLDIEFTDSSKNNILD